MREETSRLYSHTSCMISPRNHALAMADQIPQQLQFLRSHVHRSSAFPYFGAFEVRFDVAELRTRRKSASILANSSAGSKGLVR